MAITGRPLLRHVWHCAVRAAPDDCRFTDGQWVAIDIDIIDVTGIAPYGNDQTCRWIAIWYAADHIHLVAPLTR